MRDPFSPTNNSKLIREAQLGLTLVAILLCVFVYLAYYRISGFGRTIPDHVRNAPVAESVWPHQLASEAALQSDQNSLASANLELVQHSKLHALEVPESESPENFSAAPIVHHRSDIDKVPRPSNKGLPPTAASVSGSTENQYSPAKLQPLTNSLTGHDSFPPTLAHAPRKSGPKDDPFGMDFSKPSPDQVPTSTHKNSTPQPVEKFALGSNPDIDKPAYAPQTQLSDNNSFRPQPDLNTAPHTPSQGPDRPLIASTENFFPSSPIRSSPDNNIPSFQTTGLSQTQFSQSEKTSIDARNTVSNFEPTTLPAENVATEKSPTSIVSRTEAATTHFPSTELPATKLTTADPSSHPAFHIVQPGDSFWSIAQIHYDDGNYFRALYAHNQDQVPDFETLPAGVRIDTPTSAELNRRWPQLVPLTMPYLADKTVQPVTYMDELAQPLASDKIYQTRAGDTLFEIAAMRLGQASRYLEIMQLNHDRLPPDINHLSPLPSQINLLMPE